MPKLSHFYSENDAYFVTTTTQGRRPVFASGQNVAILWNTVRNNLERHRFHLLGFVIMPDHLHLVIMPRGENTVSFIMQEMKKSSARLVNKAEGRSGKLWLDEYYEHGIRTEEELMQKLRYMHENPVKKGLVESEKGYAFSSANPEYEEFLFREW